MIVFAIGLIIACVGVDQLVKLWAVNNLAPAGYLPVIGQTFGLEYHENRGAALGIFQGQQVILIIIPVILLLIAGWLLFSGRLKNKWMSIPVAVLTAGAIGNFADRIIRGFVVDLFYIKAINFPVFNVADICVTMGAFVLMGWVIVRSDDFTLMKPKKEVPQTAEEQDESHFSDGG